MNYSTVTGNHTIDLGEGNAGLENRDLTSGRGAGEKDRAVFLDAGDKVIGCEIKNPS